MNYFMEKYMTYMCGLIIGGCYVYIMNLYKNDELENKISVLENKIAEQKSKIEELENKNIALLEDLMYFDETPFINKNLNFSSIIE